MVVERAHPDVRGLGDLENRHIEFAGGDKSLRGPDERRAGAHLASLQAVVGNRLRHGHALMLAGIISIEDFVRTT